MVYSWELEKIKDWTVNKIKNEIWAHVSCGQPISECVSLEALRLELERRGEVPTGFHNT